jgi:acetyl esterase/lipase
MWYTMPFVESESLRERLTRERQLPLDDTLQITREVADAFDAQGGGSGRKRSLGRDARILMKPLIIAFCVVSAFRGLSAQAPVWQPSPGHTQMPLWTGVPPHAQQPAGPEVVTTTMDDHLVAGRPWTYISNVSRPTLTVYSPQGENTGAAVVVFPGGGYQILAIDLEGTEVCDWLTSKGITCVLLKYRVPNSGPSWDQLCGCDLDTRSSMPLEDAQRTVGLVRFHAAEWHIDPHKIGVLGFSAGGHLVAAVSTHFDRRVYAAVDAADSESCRPAFAVALYPGHLRRELCSTISCPLVRCCRDGLVTASVQARSSRAAVPFDRGRGLIKRNRVLESHLSLQQPPEILPASKGSSRGEQASSSRPGL